LAHRRLISAVKNNLVTAPDTDAVVEAEIVDESTPQARREFLAAHPPPGQPEGFIDSRELARRLGCSPGTISNMRARGLPHVIVPGGRLVRFFWPAVEQYLIRLQRGVQ
jgi:hypothetical protein